MPGHEHDLDFPLDSEAGVLEVDLLRQAAVLLSDLPDRLYTRTTSLLPGGTVGRHIRHCIDFFDCFLDGLPTGGIDYAVRRRDPTIETSCALALERLAELEGRLAALTGFDLRRSILVRSDDDDLDRRSRGVWSRSSVGRELQFLESHTVHHFALIAVLLRALGHPTDSEFGVSPSTLQQWSQVGRASRS